MDAPATDPRDAELLEQLGWVRRLALAQVRDRHAADDLAQEVARVWLEKRPRLAGGPRSWLAAVARRLVVDRARSDASRKARENAAAPARNEDGTFEVVERGARQRRVFDAVLELPEPYRATILYRYFDDLATREVAERTGVNEATVRKRVERGLALLRAQLERELGSRSDAWAIALLEPGLRTAVLQGALWKGTVLMSTKWLVAAGAVVLLAGAAWYVQASSGTSSVEEVGGTGVVVPADVAAARELAPAVLADVDSAGSRVAGSKADVAPPAVSHPGLRGFVFVDDVHTAPPGLAIQRKITDGDRSWYGRVDVDAAGACWSIDELDGAPGRLWITSDTTIPAQIPIPPEIWATGGVFDVHLSTGRSLDLTLLDRATQQALPGLEFQVHRAVVTERGNGRVVHDGKSNVLRTDAEGRARVIGVPLEGSLSVSVDFSPRERDWVMGEGTLRFQMQREPDFRLRLTPEQPTHLEETIQVSPPLGEACASGQVPAWAIAAAGGADALRVVARETTNETPQARGDAFLLPCDPGGRFELCAGAPTTLAVWLERTQGRERISAETALTFAQSGAQPAITFEELHGRAVTLRFVDVPERGELRAWLVGKDGMEAAGAMPCRGEDFAHEFKPSGDQQIRLSLTLGQDAHDKSGWSRLVAVGDEREITIDLGGRSCRLRIESDVLGEIAGDGAIVLLRVEDGEARSDQSIVALCSAGRSVSDVRIGHGRWLYGYGAGDEIAAWGVVDVADAASPSDDLVLRPRLRSTTGAELAPAIRFDEVDGVRLSKLPERMRTTRFASGTERVTVPIDARYVVLDAAK